MPIVFTKSARASAIEKALMALVSLIVGGGFAALIILLDDLHIAVIIAAGLAVLLSIVMTLSSSRDHAVFFCPSKSYSLSPPRLYATSE